MQIIAKAIGIHQLYDLFLTFETNRKKYTAVFSGNNQIFIMKRITFIATLVLLGLAVPSIARQGYKLHVKMPGVKDSMVFFGALLWRAIAENL